MPLAIGSLVWGVHDLPRSIKFWCAALNYKPLREPDDDWAILVPVEGGGPQLALDVITFDTQPRQRHHLDLYAEDQEAEVERLVAIGATRVEREYPEDADYVVLADPDGNRFCVVDKGT
ncbi:Glyoxalase/Bleomycin resistance protein/Dihydroxybiphenyl dioxygenase [Podospora aff. communis PSN243]|uniref:Glyoxalase/Bleomycin resistance protein/Dihydroxybiphenyl dioxygenase n=1 Tax=Podospora aff. communis PSN243 TaxID=3040156 RepID=A0AAV9G092_9PEZI|nr:Glyoxalase/Bleomycin resistance protein/Dihydroxybiphenyl dioxygenase [Podospora aff. communis PSN243]